MPEIQNNTPLFARSILGGKKTSKLESRVSDELKEAVRRRWHDRGYASESEYLEMLALVDVFGKEHVRSMFVQHVSMVCGLSDESTTAGAAQ